MRSIYTHIILIAGGFSVLAACTEERVPRSTMEFLENPIMLEAAMVRCSQDRTATRYDAECVNAREAVKLIEAKEEAARRADLDARSDSKRQALRRTQEAASQARKRAAEAERLRIEAEYLAQFGVVPPRADGQSTDTDTDTDTAQSSGNAPHAVIPESSAPQATSSTGSNTLPATDGGNAPVVIAEPEKEDPQTDLGSIRDELQRRNAEGED